MTAPIPLVVPEWLTHRGGTLKPGVKPETQYVMLGAQPLYRLDLRPAGGRFTCAITYSVNGKRLDDGMVTYATIHEAFASALEQLRGKLGW